MFAAASCSSSGRYGTSADDAREERSARCASAPRPRATPRPTSGSSSNSPTRYGSSSSGRSSADPVHALDEDPQGAVGDPDHLVHDRRGADLVEVVPARRAPPRRSRTVTSASIRSPDDDVVDEPDRALLADRERRHRLREDDRLLQRQHRQRRGGIVGSAARLLGARRSTSVIARPSPRIYDRASPRRRRSRAIGSTIVSIPRS